MAKLKVSIQTFDEIAAALEKEGLKLGENVGTLTLERGTDLVPPVDFRLATIRRDCTDIASKSYNMNVDNLEPFIEYVNKIYQFVLNGTV